MVGRADARAGFSGALCLPIRAGGRREFAAVAPCELPIAANPGNGAKRREDHTVAA